MIIKCLFCDYHKSKSAPPNLLKVSSDPNLPEEDQMLWTQRFVETMGISGLVSVKIHMGRMHKGEFISGMMPAFGWEKSELEIINSHKKEKVNV